MTEEEEKKEKEKISKSRDDYEKIKGKSMRLKIIHTPNKGKFLLVEIDNTELEETHYRIYNEKKLNEDERKGLTEMRELLKNFLMSGQEEKTEDEEKIGPMFV